MKLKKSMCILLAALMLGGCSLSGQQSQDLPSESLPESVSESDVSVPESSASEQPEQQADYQVDAATGTLSIPQGEQLEQVLLTDTGNFLLVLWIDQTYYMRLVSPDGMILTEKTQGSKEPAFMIRRQHGFEQDVTKYSSVSYYDFELNPAAMSDVRGSLADIPTEVAETVPGGFVAVGCYQQYLTGYSPITYSTERPSPPIFPENGSIGRYDTETGEIETVQLPAGCEPSETVGDGRYYALFCTANDENESWLKENVSALQNFEPESRWFLVFDMDSMKVTGYYSMDEQGGSFAAIYPDGKQVCLVQNRDILRVDLLPAE